MTQPHDQLHDIGYASHAPQQSIDSGHLRALAICHYVWGTLTVLGSCIFLIHVGMGAMMVSGKFSLAPPAPIATTTSPTTTPTTAKTTAAPAPMPTDFMGYMFIGIGGCLIALGWTVGGLTIYSGRCIHRQRRRVFSLVMAGINCASFPLGTLLGVFTFIVLLRASVKAMYDAKLASVPQT